MLRRWASVEPGGVPRRQFRTTDLPLGTADAIVVAVAERFRAVNIAALDRRHFSVVRPAHAAAFTLFP
jgi:predicted nucleic acid-binding protein